MPSTPISSRANLVLVGSTGNLSKLLAGLARHRPHVELAVDAHETESGARFEVRARGEATNVRALLQQLLKASSNVELEHTEDEAECPPTKATHAHLFASGSAFDLYRLTTQIEQWDDRVQLLMSAEEDPSSPRFQLYAMGSPEVVEAIRTVLLKRALDLDVRYAEHGEAECTLREEKMEASGSLRHHRTAVTTPKPIAPA